MRNNVSLEQFSPTPISLRPLTFAAVALKLYIPSTIYTDYTFWLDVQLVVYENIKTNTLNSRILLKFYKFSVLP